MVYLYKKNFSLFLCCFKGSVCEGAEEKVDEYFEDY